MSCMENKVVHEITRGFLCKALNIPKIDKFEVQEGSNPGDGYSCKLYSVDIWRQGVVLPQSILIKCFPEHPARQDFLKASKFFTVELEMYKVVLKQLSNFCVENNWELERPWLDIIYGNYYSKMDRQKLEIPLDSPENCIILPDIRKISNGGFKLRDRFQSFDLPHYKLVIEGQAQFHAISWAYKCRNGIEFEESFPFLKSNGNWCKILENLITDNIYKSEEIISNIPALQKGFQHLKNNRFSIAGLYFGFDYGQESRHDTKDSVLKLSVKANDNEAPWAVLLHGDTWSNNMLFRYDNKTCQPVEVKFIDFQISHVGDPFADICYCIFTTTTKEFRRRHLTQMLQLYFKAFTNICNQFKVQLLPGWNFQEFQRRFHRSTIFGGYMAMTTLPIFLQPLVIRDSVSTSEVLPNTEKFEDLFQNSAGGTEINMILQDRLVGVLEDLMTTNVI